MFSQGVIKCNRSGLFLYCTAITMTCRQFTQKAILKSYNVRFNAINIIIYRVKNYIYIYIHIYTNITVKIDRLI